MSAQPIHHEPDPEDPAEILGVLPGRWHAQFLAEYEEAAAAATEDVRCWRPLRDLLHLWRLRSVAYSHPEFERSLRIAVEGRPEDLVPLPGWDEWQAGRG